MVRSKMFGLGEVIAREIVGEHTYLQVEFENGKRAKLSLPESFLTGAVEPLGALKDEVEQVIAERKERLAAAVSEKTSDTSTKKGSAKPMPTGVIPSAFEAYLIDAGYSVESDSGNPSTVYSYVNAVDAVRMEEGLSWNTLKQNIDVLIPHYDVGGVKERIGMKSNRIVINALKRFAEFAA